MTVNISNFGGGVAAYRAFLIRTEGKANLLRYTLAGREKFFEELEHNRVSSKYEPNQAVFEKCIFSRKFDPDLDRKMHWVLATAKLNQAERFGVGLGEAYGKDQDKWETEPERLYVLLQEHYHTRILADVVNIFGLRMPTLPPNFLMRQMVKFFVAVPHEKTIAMVCASEIVGCRLFAALRDEGVRLFADEPKVAAEIERLFNEIFADELGHVGFLAAKMSPLGKRLCLWMARSFVWRIIISCAPELDHIIGKKQLNDIMRKDFIIEDYIKDFPTRAYAAASMYS